MLDAFNESHRPLQLLAAQRGHAIERWPHNPKQQLLGFSAVRRFTLFVHARHGRMRGAVIAASPATSNDLRLSQPMRLDTRVLVPRGGSRALPFSIEWTPADTACCGRCHAPIKSRQTSPTGDERHSKRCSGPNSRQPE